MNHFSLNNGVLHAEKTSLAAIAERFGTPCYVYSRAALEASLDEFLEELKGLDALVCYAVKANSNLGILNLFARRGAGFDIVSGGELQRALAAGAAVELDLSLVEPGQQVTLEWRGAPVWVLHRTPEMLAQIAKNDSLLADAGSAASKQPEYARNAHRSRDPKFLVVKGVCTHVGCSPTMRKEVGAAAGDLGADWPGGYFCPCHQSKFDLSARVFKGMPAPTNLEVPPYAIAGTRLVVGQDNA